MDKRLPLFMQDEITNKILREAITCIPKRKKVYLVGGSVRNSLFYKYFKKKLPFRDYDVFVSGNPKEFISNLRKKGFTYGKLRRKNERVLKKKRFPKAKTLKDFVFIDIHFSEGDIMKNLHKSSNFTINGFALPLEKIIDKNWEKEITSVKNAKRDLRNKQLHVNTYHHPAQLYACIRFISFGFKSPSKKEIEGLLNLLKKLRKNQLKRNLHKVFGQTRGEKKAEQIVKKMGIKEDVFSFKTIKKLRKK